MNDFSYIYNIEDLFKTLSSAFEWLLDKTGDVSNMLKYMFDSLPSEFVNLLTVSFCFLSVISIVKALKS